MGSWRRWFGGQTSPLDNKRAAWRAAWLAASASPRHADVAALADELSSLPLPAEEVELEAEMLDGLGAAAALAQAIATGGLPTVETGHRVVGADACHFSAPVSLPDEVTQPSGRLLLTSTRAVFAGGNPTAVPWHAVARIQQGDRDLILIRTDRPDIVRFRCNSYSDAMCAALLARHLSRRPPI